MENINESWGFRTVKTGTATGSPEPSEVWRALEAGARDRGVDPMVASDALDASRDVIVDDVRHGLVGGLRACQGWTIENNTLYAVWDGMPLETLVAHG
ncbi:hypothetical protein GS528_16705 [Rhodococcus hoagii]|nr:hypothetical protein [Prescottella equi]